ncbi:MAG: phosphomannomutase/phosphoglucomutase [Candidatus Paceibacterota bacterium]|jgi:phosphomannomutase
MNQVDRSIFKAYDIRGIYPSQLDEDVAYRIGKGYATFILGENPKTKNIVVGCDMRLSSPALKEKLISGLVDSGLNVIDVGLVSTPTFYFAVAYYGYDGGIQVSASHNPKEYNGFKLVKAKALPVSKDSGIMEMLDIIEKNRYVSSDKKGSVSKKTGIMEDLVKDQTSLVNISKLKKYKIVIDAANSMGAPDMEAFFEKVPADIVKLNFELDGSFPSHEADPLKEENLVLLKKKVVETKADFGIASDGDGDRYFLVDEKGESLRQEILRGIMAQEELKEDPEALVCYDIRPGRITKDMIDEMGGKSVVTPVGHSLIKAMMIRNNAVFGGESSGHYAYRRPYGTFEMPVILVAKFLRYLSGKDAPFSEIMKPYKIYFHSGEVNFKVKSVPDKLKEIESKFSDAEIGKLDGITVTYPDWWFNVRGSNTEPVIRLNLEAKSEKLRKEGIEKVSRIIEG